MFITAAAGAIARALYPVWWAFVYQIPIGVGVAYVVTGQQARAEISKQAVRMVAALVGVGGSLVFGVCLGLTTSWLLLVIAVGAMWVGVSMILDRCLEVDWETSQRITSLICVPIWLLWIIVGVVVMLVG